VCVCTHTHTTILSPARARSLPPSPLFFLGEARGFSFCFLFVGNHQNHYLTGSKRSYLYTPTHTMRGKIGITTLRAQGPPTQFSLSTTFMGHTVLPSNNVRGRGFGGSPRTHTHITHGTRNFFKYKNKRTRKALVNLVFLPYPFSLPPPLNKRSARIIFAFFI
jgi:hypothetical protein